MPADTNLDRAIYDLLAKQCPAMWLGIPIGIGDVYWVDSNNGNDANVGTQPNLAFATITHALVHCQNNHNDYIMVIAAAAEAVIIDINKTRVHIIGVGDFLTRPNQTNPPVPLIAPAALGVLQVSAASNYCEIAGFMIGGAANHAGIENTGAVIGLHVHDCVFGHTISGGAPADGIFIDINAVNIRVENCIFLGTPGGKGLLTRDGIRWDTATDPLNGNIENCQFKGLPGIAINFVAVTDATGGITIKDNVIACKENPVVGDAITLAATTRGFLVAGNKALYGKVTAAMANNPYLDLTVVAPFNAWMENYKGNALIDPA